MVQLSIVHTELTAGEFFKGFNNDPIELYGAENELRKILGHTGRDIKVVPPFTCTHGHNTFLGDGVHINLETFFDDTKKIRLGNRVLTGPFLRILGEVQIGDDVWIGGGVTIHPGVKIGRGAVISAGSVVKNNVAPNALMVGSPARQIREINQTEIPEGIKTKTSESELQKMITGKVFFSSDPQLKADKQKAYEFFRAFNRHEHSNLESILGRVGENVDTGILYITYGYQIFIGNGVRIGDRVYLGDAGKITIGDMAIIEEEAQLYTTNHCLPIPYRGYILGEDITIGPRAKIGKRAIILPGVTIGEAAVVEENSVVNHDVLPNTTVSGIPAKVK